MPKFAANLSMMFNEWAFLDRFAAAADAGFGAVEYLFPYAFKPDDIAERLRRHKLTQVLFNLPPGDFDAGDRGTAAIASRASEFVAGLETATPFVRATGVKRIHMMAGNATNTPDELQAYRASIAKACAWGTKLGVEILIEPINRRDMPNYFLNDFKLATDLIASEGLPNLKLQYDIYHRQIIQGDVTKGLEALLPITSHIQIASVPLRHEPNTGELNDTRIFKLIDQLGYQGHIGCEYRPANGTLNGLSWFKGLAS
jgi:2-dehydrotetronate isomerase